MTIPVPFPWLLKGTHTAVQLHSFPLESNRPMKLALNTKHSIRDTQGNVTSVAWWVPRCPWHTIVSYPNHTAARGNSEMNITCTTCIFTQWLHMRFESWVNFQNASLLTFSIYAKKSYLRPHANQGLHAFQRASLSPAPSMSNISG